MQAKACIEASRPLNSFMMGLAVVVGAAIAGASGEDLARILAGALVGVLYTAASMIDNDIVDMEIDRINRPERPIPSGRLPLKTAQACIVVLVVAGAVVASYLGSLILVASLVAVGLAMAYNRWGKPRGLVGNVMVAGIVAFPIVYGALVVDRLTPTTLVFASMVFLSTVAREIVKDIADIEGDKAAGARTFPVTHGSKTAARVAAILYLLAVALSPLPVLLDAVNPPVYIGLVSIVDAILVMESIRLFRGVDEEEALMHKRRVLYAMLLGLIAFLAGVRV